MMGRREFGIAGVSSLALAAFHNRTEGADQANRDKVFDECAEACSKCQRTCDACARHCATLISEGQRHHLATLRTCLDCADLCSAASHIVARKGVFSGQVCTACADACAKCAAECDKHASDTIMVQCAKDCRVCENACREMLK